MNCEIESLEERCLFSTYFVNAASGNDLNNGRSVRTPWQNLSAVNGHVFKPGDRVLLSGAFSNESLVLAKNATGITVDSYTFNPLTRVLKAGATGVTALTNLTGDGIDILTSGVTIENVTITADPDAVSNGNYSYGIYLHNETSSGLSRETIDNVSASGFSYSGLCLQGWNTTASNSAGFANVLIENSSFNNNQVSGIFAAAGDSTGNEFQPEFPDTLYLNSNLTIKNCVASNNEGFNGALAGVADGTQLNQGTATAGGIFVSSVKGAIVENCTTVNNCINCEGGVGTWAFDATAVVFQDDESADTKTVGGSDGDGFDLDHGVTHSIMQRDYSHGNDGNGFLIAATGGVSNDAGDTIRYCVSDGDGQLNGDFAIAVSGSTEPVVNANIYNNTLLSGNADGLSLSTIGVFRENLPGASVNIFNNILFTTDGGSLVVGTVPAPGVRFIGNDYWRTSATNDQGINWGGTVYPTLADWAAGTGEETDSGKIVGHVQDPGLGDEMVSDLPKTDVKNLMLSPLSPLAREGLNLAGKHGLSAAVLKGSGDRNLFGKKINGHAVGAG